MQNTKDAVKNQEFVSDLLITMKVYEEYSLFSENVPRVIIYIHFQKMQFINLNIIILLKGIPY